MHDLRRQALESGKTVSRKARSKQSSRHSSRPISRANSRPASRQGSDDEGELSDETTWSAQSIDDILSNGEEITEETWKSDLADRISEILDRKRSSIVGREEALSAYQRILTAKYARDQIKEHESQLIAAFLRSVKAESSEKETVLALKALALTIITEPLDDISETAAQRLQTTITDSESHLVKVSAIHALGVCTFFGGASDEETFDILAFLLSIIESDGTAVNASDVGAVVTAALEEWGFLATSLDDLEAESNDYMDAFLEQLDSNDAGVQVAAGENIALTVEKSFTELEPDEDEQSDDIQVSLATDGTKLVRRYEPYRRMYILQQKLAALANISSKRLSKRDKKSLHISFSDILNTVENPTKGPRYSTALDQETGREYGSRMIVRIHKTGTMRIDTWWKFMRLKALRRVLGGGFVNHYVDNEVVFESLPVMIRRDA